MESSVAIVSVTLQVFERLVIMTRTVGEELVVWILLSNFYPRKHSEIQKKVDMKKDHGYKLSTIAKILTSLMH
ncbi:hypothetical protein EUGRSUZ_K02029 [Eucalyptus grandis]|uniref:Uncharacterized protein n=2 Tax=Eucalyptus grandis TaxID=71139 RepID=A0ACC3IXZ2_EUCGR|nr:hypothetical protein EUGRSUZ_K02029 [Eucalyptus grandis]